MCLLIGMFVVVLLSQNMPTLSSYPITNLDPIFNDAVQLTKSLGVSLRKSREGDLDDNMLGGDYLERYMDMMKINQDLQELNFANSLDHKFKNGSHMLDTNEQGMVPTSSASRRRARSQASRRRKLNTQGLNSHLSHSKKLISTNEGYSYD